MKLQGVSMETMSSGDQANVRVARWVVTGIVIFLVTLTLAVTYEKTTTPDTCPSGHYRTVAQEECFPTRCEVLDNGTATCPAYDLHPGF